MFINQLSMRKDTLPISVMLNSSKTEDEHLFEIAKILAPKVKFIRFIKKQKNENLDDIMWYFKVNYETAKRYKKQLSKEELKKMIPEADKNIAYSFQKRGGWITDAGLNTYRKNRC